MKIQNTMIFSLPAVQLRFFSFLFFLIPLFITGCTKSPNSQLNRIDDTKFIFPLDTYNQDVDAWISSDTAGYNRPLLKNSIQQTHFSLLLARYFGTASEDESPWNRQFIERYLAAGGQKSLASLEKKFIETFTATSSAVYGENFRPRTAAWKQQLADNTHIEQFLIPQHYDQKQRAIIITEAPVRHLPATTPAFSDFQLAGEGYPFDNLQHSALLPATPVYILGTSRDKAWKLVLSPSVTGWVNSEHIARVNNDFVNQWRTAAMIQLGALINEPVSVSDNHGHFRFMARIGTLLPIQKQQNNTLSVLIPVGNDEGYATIRYASMSADDVQLMPLPATPKNFSHLIKVMNGKTYGWGNMYANNDCSAELRNLIMPFGIFLPRHSADQSRTGKQTDLSQLTPAARLNYLKTQADPFMSLIYIGGHIMLYIGNAEVNGQSTPIVYQNIWGLRPADGSQRAIIGQSVIFPLLQQYPQTPSFQSLAGKKQFIVTQLNKLAD